MWANKMMIWLLRSPLHPLVSGSVLLLSVTGRRSGKQYSLPVNYVGEGQTLWIISQRQRTWWRNLVGGAALRLLIRGQETQAFGSAIVEPQELASALQTFFRSFPRYARYFKLTLDESGSPSAEDCARQAQRRVLIRIELQEAAG